MIELKLDLYELRKNPHETLINIKLVEAMRAAGIPVVGKLIPCGVEYGTLILAVDEDLDGDALIVQWYDRGEYKAPITSKLPTTRLNMLAVRTKAPVVEDDEL